MAIAEKQQIFEAIEKSVNPLIIIPQTPQGDAIGGSLALFLALKKTGKHPRIVCFGDMPENFSFLFESVEIEKEIENEKMHQISLAAGENKIKEVSYDQNGGNFNIYFNAESGAVDIDSLKIYSRFKYDLILTVGIHDLESLGEIYSLRKEIFSSLKIINIDNSEINSQFGNINAVEGYFPSVSEIAAEIIHNVLLLEYDKEIATALLAGIISETNNFQALSIAPETFALAGALLASGARRAEIIRHFYGIDFGAGNSGKKINLPEKFKAESGGQDIKKEIIGEENKLIAAPASGLVEAVLSTGESLKSFYQPNILASRIWNFKSGVDELLLAFRRLNFWIIFTIVLAIIIFRMGILNNIFLSLNSFWTRIYASASEAGGKITTKSSALFVPQKINSDSKSANYEIIYSASKIEKKNIGLPVKLAIPKLGIEAEFQEVGLDASSTMETPTNSKDVGWFNLGPRPGEIGNAVVTGHLDAADTANGVFRRLNELGAGDDVYVTDSENNKLHFQVVSSKIYDAKNAPMEEIFGRNGEARLNLVTCNGVWDKKAVSYDKRLVVFTKLVAGI